MNRRRFLGVAAAFGAATATGACGIPGSSEPKFLESGRPANPQGDIPAEPPGPSAASTARDLVINYLTAAAGANYAGAGKPEALAQAQARARAYLKNEAQQGWAPTDLLVVRATVDNGTPDGKGGFDVRVGLVVLGRLNKEGAIESTTATISVNSFRVVLSGSEFRLESAPNALLISDEGLKRYYSQQVIYFWDADAPVLVPEQRYLPNAIGVGQRPAEIVRWLTGGPSAQWLQAAVLSPPAENIEVKEASFVDSQRLIVNLSAKAAGMEKDVQHRFAVQVRWSTGANGGVDLRIEGASTGVSTDDFVNYNTAAAGPDSAREPERYCVVNRSARPVNTKVAAEILDSDANADVVSAAIGLKKSKAALVRQEARTPKVVHRLWVGSLTGTGDTKSPIYAPTNLASAHMSRPVWISRPAPQVLVAADGRLFSARAPLAGHSGELPVTALNLPAAVPRPVTAVSVSPDGRRIALIAGGQVVVAALKLADPIAIDDRIGLVRTDLASPRAVAWSAETKLLVGGEPMKGTKTGLVEITIDGAGQESVPPNGSEVYPINLMSVRPASPPGSPTINARLAMVDANSSAYIVYEASISPLPLGEGSTPQPSPSGPPAQLSAPFFPD